MNEMKAFTTWPDGTPTTREERQAYGAGWDAAKESTPGESLREVVLKQREAFVAGADAVRMRAGFVNGLGPSERKLCKAEAARRYPTRPAEIEMKLVHFDHDPTLTSKHDPNRYGLD